MVCFPIQQHLFWLSLVSGHAVIAFGLECTMSLILGMWWRWGVADFRATCALLILHSRFGWVDVEIEWKIRDGDGR